MVTETFNKDDKVLWHEELNLSDAEFLYEAYVVDVYEFENEDGLKHFEYKIHFRKWPKRCDLVVSASALLKDNTENREMIRERGIPIGVRAVKDKKIHSNTQKKTPKRKKYVDEMAEGSGGTPLKSTHSRDASKRNESHAGMQLHLSDQFAGILNYDKLNVTEYGYKHDIPAKKTILEILEDFVKMSAVDHALSIIPDATRGRVTDQRRKQLESDLRLVVIKIKLLKEAVDGIRIYFDFMLKTRLLYVTERTDVDEHISKENLSKAARLAVAKLMPGSNHRGSATVKPKDKFLEVLNGYIEEITKWKSGKHIYHTVTTAKDLPDEVRTFLNEIFVWRLLPDETDRSPIMVYGATHLARLMVLMPEFINKTKASDKKKDILKEYFTNLVNYLESHEEWFDQNVYKHIKR